MLCLLWYYDSEKLIFRMLNEKSDIKCWKWGENNAFRSYHCLFQRTSCSYREIRRDRWVCRQGLGFYYGYFRRVISDTTQTKDAAYYCCVFLLSDAWYDYLICHNRFRYLTAISAVNVLQWKLWLNKLEKFLFYTQRVLGVC